MIKMNMGEKILRMKVEEWIEGVKREEEREMGIIDKKGKIEIGKDEDIEIWEIERKDEIV